MGFITDRAYREQKVQSWTSIGLLVFISAFVWAPSRDGLEAIYALAFFLPMLCVLPWRRLEFHAYGGWFSVLSLGFGAYAALTSLWAPVSDLGFFIQQWLILAVWLCGVSWLACAEKINTQQIMQVLIVVGAVGSLVNLVVFYHDQSWNSRMSGWSVTRNPNNVGSIFGAIALLAYIHWLSAKSLQKNALSAICLVAIMLSLLASQSRASIIAFLLLVPVCLWWCKPSRLKLWLHALLVFVVLAIIGWFWPVFVDMFVDRGVSDRNLIWLDIIQRSIEDHPLLGRGLEKEGRIIIPDVNVFNHAHNPWLDTFYRTGLLGLLLQVAGLLYVLRAFSLSPKLFPLYVWLLFGLIYSFLDSRGFFWQIDPKWFCYWLPAGLIAALVSADRSVSADKQKECFSKSIK